MPASSIDPADPYCWQGEQEEEEGEGEEEDDVFTSTPSNAARTPAGPGAAAAKAAATLDLEPKGTHLGRVLSAEEVPADHQGMMLAAELVNCQVDKTRLAGDNKLMRFVSKIASSAPAKGREKRHLVVSVSAELPPPLAPPNPAAALEFTECGRTDTSYDDADATFALPVAVLCRKGTDRYVRLQVEWSQNNLVTGGDSTVLGQHVERFSELMAKTAALVPLRFEMTSSSCPKAGPAAHALLWRLPFAALKPPCTPFVDMAARRHVSYSVPYLFRRRDAEGGSVGTAKARQQQQQQQEKEAELGPEGLLLAREMALEGRFAFRLAALILQPFVKQMEAALGGWRERYEQERIDQGFFASDAEAFEHGRVLVRLTVAEASFLPLLKNSGGGVFAGLRSGGPGGGEKPKVVIPSVNLSQQAQKLARARVGAGEKRLASHPFVAVTLERPRPWQGLLIGHTNTEYATQAPMAAAAPQEQQAFLFYAPQIDVGQAHLRFELFHETSTSAAARIRLDSRYTKFGSVADHPDASKDVEAWLPLLDRDGQPTGRLLVRVGLFASASTVGSTTASSTSSIYGSGVGGGPVDLISFDGQEAALSPPAAPVPTLSPTPSDAVASADHAAAANRRACYEWTRQAGFSGKAPRECDVFTGAGATGGTERVHVRYPLDWLKQHIDSLAKDLSVLQSALRLSEQAAAEGRGFRSSEHKVTPELQGVATNVHSQTFVLADMGALLAAGVGAGALADGAAATATAAAAGAKFHVYDLVSAGAPTAHALGFHAGGLVSQQQAMARLQREMAALDQQIQGLVGAQGPYLPTGSVGELCRQLQGKLLTFEAMLAKTTVRRILCVSQALGIATTSLATKLDVMLTEHADQTLAARTADGMVKGGFLVCFQGLISTIGKEHGMLEDVAIAMELASLYQFELRPKRQSGPTSGDGSGLDGLKDDLLLAFDSPTQPPVPSKSPMSRRHAASSCADLYGGSQGPSLALEVEFDAATKRVHLLLEPAAIDRLPPAMKMAFAASPDDAGSLVVPIVALLFCQGIDVHQSFANFSNQLKGKGKDKDGGGGSGSGTGATAGAEEGAAEANDSVGIRKGSKKVGGDSTIQPIINRRSLMALNAYCHRCHPLPTSTSEAAAAFDRFAERFEASDDPIPGVHPMLAALRDAVKQDTGSAKIVELLREQERAVLALGGGQVIFCKSGKDRTGMAVTLLQARLLGDQHGCSGTAVVRNANAMRVHGTRLLLCGKNVGIPKYAFNKLQLQFMPAEYRPPTETIFELGESIMNRDRT